MAIAAVGLGACDDRRPQPLTIDNALTADEIAAGRLTPEVMWKMSRAGSSSLSPDGKTLLYAQTDYNMAQNRGVTTIWVQDMASGAVTRLTDTASNNADPKWSADGRKIYFLSDRSGSMQVWRMNAAGGDATQVTGSGGGEGVPDVEGFGVSPDEKHIWWVQAVQTARRKSSDVYKDMDKSKARIYDDLMARHWDYWDEGSYRHIFIGELGKGLVTGGTDIMPDAQWDAPLAPYFDMAEIAWNNAGTMLAYTCKPLTGTEYAVSTDSDIFVYVLESGVTQNICKPVNVNTGEPVASDKAVMAGYDKYPVWSPDDTKIAFLSQRRAGNESDKARLFLYDCRTGEMQDLTEDFDYNAMNVVWEGNDRIWFIAPIEATHQICRISPSVGEVEVVTRGDHDINAFSMAGDRIVAEMCTISMATEFFGIDPADASRIALASSEVTAAFDLLENPFADDLALEMRPELTAPGAFDALREQIEAHFSGSDTPERRRRLQQLARARRSAAARRTSRGTATRSPPRSGSSPSCATLAPRRAGPSRGTSSTTSTPRAST